VGGEHWLTLSLTQGIGPILGRRMIEAAGGVEAACRADANLLANVEGIGLARSRKIASALKKAADEAQVELAKAAAQAVLIVCPDDDTYPALLHTIPDPPLALYVRGTLQPRDLHAVAIVGSRKCSLYGREQAERFGALLAGAGITVISGGARGIDSAAHRGALQHPQGRTIAVLGSGVDVPYPPENTAFFDDIAQRGAVISEFPMGTPPNRENFPRRNRIVSGMSRGVLVVEADERSGALITARQAGDDHGRPVFALPGRVDNPLSKGPHQLIRDGAVLTMGLEDILDGLGPVPHAVTEPTLFDKPTNGDNKIEPPPATASSPISLIASISPEQQKILVCLEVDPRSIDSIIESVAMPAAAVLRELTFLTLKGLVRRVDGQNWARRS
jgi:DNA processing protein